MKNFPLIAFIPLIISAIGLYYVFYLFFKKILTPKKSLDKVHVEKDNSVNILETKILNEPENIVITPYSLDQELHKDVSLFLNEKEVINDDESLKDDGLPEDVIIEIIDPELKEIFDQINKTRETLSETTFEDGNIILKNGNEDKLRMALADNERRRLSLERINKSAYGSKK